MEDKILADPMEVPFDSISEELLDGIVSDFVLREGTDYGQAEYSLDEKKAQVIGLLQSGKVKIAFDPESETCTIVEASFF